MRAGKPVQDRAWADYGRPVPQPTRLPVRLVQADPASPSARAVTRAYFQDIVDLWYGRSVPAEEIDQIIADHAPGVGLVAPSGALVLAVVGSADGQVVGADVQTRPEDVVGCAGVRYVDAVTAELTQVFVRPSARGQGAAARLVTEVEELARLAGRTRIRLETRSDMVDAHRLYARLGYRDVPSFVEGPYSHMWLGKAL